MATIRESAASQQLRWPLGSAALLAIAACGANLAWFAILASGPQPAAISVGIIGIAACTTYLGVRTLSIKIRAEDGVLTSEGLLIEARANLNAIAAIDYQRGRNRIVVQLRGGQVWRMPLGSPLADKTRRDVAADRAELFLNAIRDADTSRGDAKVRRRLARPTVGQVAATAFTVVLMLWAIWSAS